MQIGKPQWLIILTKVKILYRWYSIRRSLYEKFATASSLQQYLIPNARIMGKYWFFPTRATRLMMKNEAGSRFHQLRPNQKLLSLTTNDFAKIQIKKKYL